jgi:soluble lytic murein transglycosylase
VGRRGRRGADAGAAVRLVAALLVVAVAAGAAVVTTEPTWYLRLRYPLDYAEIVRGHARNYGLEPELLAAVIYAESKFDADARSASGAIGLMQLLPETARGIALRTGGSNFRTEDLYDPELNVRYGSWYLRHLLQRYDGDLRKALAAYNGGQGNVDRGIEYDETKAYVERVRDVAAIYRRAYRRELRVADG